MKYPKFIKEKSCIGIPAPSAGSGVIEKENKLKNAVKRLESLGYELVVSENLFKCEKGRSAEATKRADEFNSMLKNEEIDCILCATGGDFLVEILPYIDFDYIKDNPKLIAGFSDPTGILFPITTNYDIATIYGHNLSSLGQEKLHKSQEDFLKIISGDLIIQTNYDYYEEESPKKVTGLENYNLKEPVIWKTLGEKSVNVTGRIIGGCFDIIAELAGTKYDGTKKFIEKYKDDGIIWYFDNCELSMEETIRVLWKFNTLGYFNYTKAIIFGRFGVEKSYYDYNVKSCLEDSVISKLNIPIIYDADISHKAPCLTIINGSIATLSVCDGDSSISFELK